MTKQLLAVTLFASALLAGCNQTTATQPSSGSPSGTPILSGTTPTQPSLSASPQLLNVLGSQFATGLVATVAKPNGQVLTINSSDIGSLTATAFQLLLTLDVAGNYQLQVKNSNGLVSTPFTFTVGSAVQGALTLTSVSPASLTASSQLQVINITGANFDPSLQATVTAPNSLQTFYGPSAMTGLNSTSFSLNATFDVVGTYSIVVSNNSSSISNSLTIDVRK